MQESPDDVDVANAAQLYSPSCVAKLNLTAKFDGDIFGEVFRRKPSAK